MSITISVNAINSTIAAKTLGVVAGILALAAELEHEVLMEAEDEDENEISITLDNQRDDNFLSVWIVKGEIKRVITHFVVKRNPTMDDMRGIVTAWSKDPDVGIIG